MVILSVSRVRSFTSEFFVSPAPSESSADSRIRSVAGQLGLGAIAGQGSQPTATPGFIAYSAKSITVLSELAADTSLRAAYELRPMLREKLSPLASDSVSPHEWHGRAIRALAKTIRASEDKKLGAVRIRITTQSPHGSLRLAKALLNEIQRQTAGLGQRQAAAERIFVEQRVAERQLQIDVLESAQSAFLEKNRDFQNSQQLTLQYERRQREISLQNQVQSQLQQSLEDARIREVRDTPRILVLEEPRLPTEPNARGTALAAAAAIISFGTCSVLVLLWVWSLSFRPASAEAGLRWRERLNLRF